jgi:hypothetical protein
MSLITDMLLSQLGGGQLDNIAGALGADSSITQKAMQAAIPALLGGLASNAATPAGAASLASALDNDHDGSMLDNVGSLLGMFGGGGASKSGMGGLMGAAAGMLGGGGASKAANGAGILKHVFGSKESAVAGAVSEASGMDLAQAGKLLAMVAPLVMGAVGKAKKANGLDAGSLASMLAGEKEQVAAGAPALGGLMGMLDADGDGDIKDDVAKLGAGLLKNMFSK